MEMDTLYRSSDEGMLAGVCAGLARKFDLNVTGLRWAVALVSLFMTGLPVIAYLILCVVLKPRPTSGMG
jgi:phage shock protein C